MIRAGYVVACHDLSDGGLLVAVAEMAMTGGRGAVLDRPPPGLPRSAFLFGEDQARYVVETADPGTVLKAAHAVGVPAHVIGTVGGVALTLQDAGAISVNALRATNEAWLPDYMAAGVSEESGRWRWTQR
jgi:phosphoribosylformylglycinamidine synthase